MTSKTRCRVGLILAMSLLVAPLARAAVDVLRKHVEYLASEDLAGRLTGTAGERLAADYIECELRRLGAEPLPGADGYRFPFEFTAGTNDAGSSLTIAPSGDEEPSVWQGLDSVRALSFSDNGVVQGSVVFAGYGLTVPESQDLSYDSYVGIDVEDKIVVVLRYWPEELDDETRAELTPFSGLRYKALQAREHGAKALLVVTGPNSPNSGKTIKTSFDAALSGSGIVAASVGGDLAERLFRSVEGGLSRAQTALDSGNPHVTGFEIPDLTLTVDVKVERERRTGHNVIGLLPGRKQDSAADPDRSYLMLGAHYDHLGQGRHGNSRANKDEADQIHFGADDNASGVAAVLAAGTQLALQPDRPPVILAFWSGEELGLLGSSNFVAHGALPTERIIAYLNFDMVGRMRDNRLSLQGVGSSSAWPLLIEQTNVVVGFDVRTQSDPYLPTDASILYRAGVPIVNFFTGNHEDYHRPTDRSDAVNYTDLDRVAQFASIFARKIGGLDEPPDYLEVERRAASGGSRDSVRAYTGTIPDYTTEVDDLRLSGVIRGGPAEQAGLKEGDVIIEFAGRRITNIYDYTYALDSVKIDQTIAVVCMRDGQRMELSITPTTRP